MKYVVHGYELVRVKVVGIEADSQEDAIQQLQKSTEYSSWRSKYFLNGGPANIPPYPWKVDTVEWAEETAWYLVDEENDPDFERSGTYNEKLRRV